MGDHVFRRHANLLRSTWPPSANAPKRKGNLRQRPVPTRSGRAKYSTVGECSESLFGTKGRWVIGGHRLAWIPTETRRPNKTGQIKDYNCRFFWFFSSPLLVYLLYSMEGCPNSSRSRFFPSQGIGRSVLSKPAAMRNGLRVRFWNRTTISLDPIVILAVASMKSRNRCRALADSYPSPIRLPNKR